jgi:hypothetical protein
LWRGMGGWLAYCGVSFMWCFIETQIRAYLDSGITHELRSHRHLHELLNSKITKDLVTQTQDHTTPRDSKLKISTQDLESRVRTQELPPPASSASSLSSSSPSPPLPRKSWKYLALMASQLGLNADLLQPTTTRVAEEVVLVDVRVSEPPGA